MDPNTIPQARLIERISFQEMAELANFGAKILHPATLAPCLRAKIPVTIASTFAPDGGNTYISPENIEDNAPSQFRAISMRKKQILVTVRSLNMLDVHGFLARLFTLLAHYRVSVDLMTTSEISVAMTIDSTSWGSHGNNPFHNEKMMQELGEIAEVTIEEGLTLVAVVGSGLTDAKTVQMILSKVVEHPIRVVCYGASSSSIGLLVQEPAALSVVQALHQGLITMPDYALA
jgi:aspartate kinase